MVATVNKYVKVWSIAVQLALNNFKALLGLSFFLIASLLIFSNLWQIVAAKVGAHQLPSDRLLWYIALNEWFLISLFDIHSEIEGHLQSGRLAYLLIRPISYLGTLFAEALGTLCVNLAVLGPVAFAFTYWQLQRFPFSLVELAVIALLTLMACCVAILFQMAIGFFAFWLHESDPIYWVWEKFLFMLGGLLLPLSTYPEWLQAIAFWTPFPSLLGGRSALAISYNSAQAAEIALKLVIWGGVALLLLQLLYRRAVRILNIEGG